MTKQDIPAFLRYQLLDFTSIILLHGVSLLVFGKWNLGVFSAIKVIENPNGEMLILSSYMGWDGYIACDSHIMEVVIIE